MEKLTRRYERWLPYLIYALLALAILGPLLKSGYLLTLDLVFIPHPDYTPSFYGVSENLVSMAATPFYLLLQLLSHIAPVWLLEKVLLFLILFLAGVGAHKLLPVKGLGSYFSGLLYMINPFTYARFLAGQWMVLVGYALAPFAVKAFIELLQGGGKRAVIKVVAFSTLVGLVDIHCFFLLFLIYAVIALVKLIKERRSSPALKLAGKNIGQSAALFIGLNVYWIVSALTATGTALEQIGPQDMFAFAPRGTSNLGIGIDIASMHGFWRDAYINVTNLIPGWWIFPLLILFLAIFGLLTCFKDKKAGWVGVSFSLLWIIGLFLALGVTVAFTRPLFTWLYDNLPFFKGFRDSQKFVALLCLAYAYLGGLGINELMRVFREQRKKLAKIGISAFMFLMLVIPLVYSFNMFGFHGQLGVISYPPEWYEVNDYLNRDSDDCNILVLPWHMYMDFNWLPNTDKRLANCVFRFFAKPIISGDNLEMPGIYTQSSNPVSHYVEFLLGHGSTVNNLGELLAPLDVKYVLLVHMVDYLDYNYLYRQDDLAVALERPGLTLFQNEHPTSRANGVDGAVYIDSLEEYLELSKSQDVTEHLYIIGSGSSVAADAPMEKLTVTGNGPVSYQVEGTSQKYTVFTVPQNFSTNNWEYNNQPATQNLGFIPAFASSPGGGEIVYTRFYRVYLPCYIISGLTFCLMVFFSFWSRDRKKRRNQAGVKSLSQKTDN
jgi:hypothetical protein